MSVVGDPLDKHDLLTQCTSFLDSHDEVLSAYLSSYPASSVFEIPISRLDRSHPSLVTDWRTYPSLIEEQMRRALESFIDDDALDDSDVDADPPEVVANTTVRIVGHLPDELYDVGQYPPDDVAGRVIHVRGQVTKRSKRKLRDEVVWFECVVCGTSQQIRQTGTTLQTPHECSGCERNGPFDVDDRRTEMRDFQHIRVQTLPEEADRGSTEMIDLQVYDELVGELNPGDRAILNVEMIARRDSQDSLERELEGTVRAMEKLTGDHEDLDIEEYEDDIREIAESDDPYTPIFDSVAPFHEGDEYVKQAIAYQLFGGIEKELADGTWFRGNSHVLLMGDPGAGKTAILKYVTNLVPRSEYATGKSTSAGLTGTAQKDEFADGGWSLQAGALVKASGGLAAIDELDKMDSEDTAGFMEALSDQQVTVTMVVSGILPAKTAVLAAANPKYGTFNPMEDIGAQLDLNEVLLSRFDLWFVMRDEPDESLDEAVSRTMTETARIGQKERAGRTLSSAEEEKAEPDIPPEMFKAYVALAKQHYPVFTKDAMDRIVSEYVDLRQVNDEDGPVPTTHRLVEAIHRISEASARMRLDDAVEVADVERALDILYESLSTLGIDPDTGELDATRMETGKSSSTMGRMKALRGIIEGQSTDESPASYDDVKEEAMVLMEEDELEATLRKLKKRDEIYEPTPQEYRTL